MSLHDKRTEIVQALGKGGAGLKITDHVPSRVTPPVVILSPADPYVTGGDDDQTFDTTEFECRFTLYLLVGTATNRTETKRLDDMIATVLLYLPGWGVEQVERPYLATVQNSEFYATTITVTTKFNL